MITKDKQFWQRGAISILALIGVLVVTAMIPVTTRLVKQREEARTYAAECGPKCYWAGDGENWDCGGEWCGCCRKLARDKSDCDGCPGGGGGGGAGGGGGGGTDCERDTEGACNRACCDPGSPPAGKICDVPNGHCQSGFSSRGTGFRKVKQCTSGEKCYWQICDKDDPNCVSNCSSHGNCREGEAEPSPKPPTPPSPPSGGKCGGNGERCNDENKCDIEGGCNPACCAYNSQCVNGKICDVPNGYCVSDYSNRGCQTAGKALKCVGTRCVYQVCPKGDPCQPGCRNDSNCGAPVPPPANPCEGIDGPALITVGDRCVQCQDGGERGSSDGPCVSVERCQGQPEGTIVEVSGICFECQGSLAVSVECPTGNPCEGIDWGYNRSGNGKQCFFCYFGEIEEYEKMEDCNASDRCQDKEDGHTIEVNNKCFRCRDGRAEPSYRCDQTTNPCEGIDWGYVERGGQCIFCHLGGGFSDKKIEECGVSDRCQRKNNGEILREDNKCFRCWDGQAEVGYKCGPPAPPPEEPPFPREAPSPSPSPPSTPGWSGDFCSKGRVCTPGFGPRCEKCPRGERCSGFPGFAHCVPGNSSISGDIKGSKIANGTITFKDDLGKTYTTKTDQEGNFSLDVPTNQDYTVTFSAPGYKILAFNWNPVDGLDYSVKAKLEKTDSQKEGVFALGKDTRDLLLAGWNLISLSAKPPEPLLASELIDEINRQGGLAVAVSRWQDGRWQTYVSGLEKNDFPIELGRAYFIENLQETKFKLEGEEITQPLPLELKSGWNAIGLPKTANCPEQTCSAQSFLNLIDETKPQSAKVFSHFESGLWEAVAKEREEFFGYDFSVKPGWGYFLKLSQPLKLLP